MADKAKEKNKVVEIEKFIMTNADGKKIVIYAPCDSIDKDKNAESALEGVYRHA